MSISVGSNAASYLNYAGNAYGAGNTASKASPVSTDTTDTSSPSSSTSVTLSDEAKAYLAQTAAESEQPSVATLTTRARAWFDQQYVALGTSSAMLDGQVAVDLSGQTRATLSAIADNAQSQFSTDEVTAATRTLQSRFQRRRVPPCRDCPAHGRLCKPLRRGVGLSRSGWQRREGNSGLERSEAGRAGGPGRRQGKLRQGSCHRQRCGPGESVARQGADTNLLRPRIQARIRWQPTRGRCSTRRRAAPGTTARTWSSPAAGRPGSRWISPTSTIERWRSWR